MRLSLFEPSGPMQYRNTVGLPGTPHLWPQVKRVICAIGARGPRFTSLLSRLPELREIAS